MIITSSKLHSIIKSLIKEQQEQVCKVEPDKKNTELFKKNKIKNIEFSGGQYNKNLKNFLLMRK